MNGLLAVFENYNDKYSRWFPGKDILILILILLQVLFYNYFLPSLVLKADQFRIL
jgi:hypothetical protein